MEKNIDASASATHIIDKTKLIEELQDIINKIEVLSDDEGLSSSIIEGIILIFKVESVYLSDINDLIWEKYPGINTDSKLRAEGKNELFSLVYKLHKILKGAHAKKNCTDENSIDYMINYRKEVEQEIFKVFYPGGGEFDKTIMEITGINIEDNEKNMNECGITGEVTQQLDSMDI